MSDDDSKQALQNAILEWQQKYNVTDGDPLLAAVELWEIYFTHAQLNGPKPPSFEDFRSTMKQLERLCGDFTGRAAETIKELREVPKIRSDLNRFPIFALVFSAALALLAGILIGRYAR
jgi:hypothetical protein